MPVQFTCPHCGQLLSVARRKIGDAVQCVRCHGGVVVPAPLSLDTTAADENEVIGTPTADPDSYAARAGSAEPLAVGAGWGSSESWNVPISVTRMALCTLGGVIVGVAIVAFLLGWAMGRETAYKHAAAAPGGLHRVLGRISYATSRGEMAADSESVVIALPTSRKPDEKLEISTLRPDVASPPALDPSVQAIRAIGGDYARTDRTGGFDLELSEAGEYFLLVISSHLARPSSEPPTTTEIVELGRYFKQPDMLLRKKRLRMVPTASSTGESVRPSFQRWMIRPCPTL